MSFLPSVRQLLLASALLLVSCAGDSPERQSSAVSQNSSLPPPLSELTGSSAESPSATFDSADWRLPDKDSDSGHPPWLRLFFSQDNRGELDPCGCPGSPSGGMARRATLVRNLRRLLPDAVVVEGPTCLSRAVLGTEVVRGEHRSRARLLLELLAETKPEAFFPGNADFEVIEPLEMARLGKVLGLPMVASNLRPGFAEGFFRPSLMVTVGERRVLLLGLVAAADNEDVRSAVPVVDAVAAAEKAILAAESEHGSIDLVVAFTDSGLRELAEWRSAGLDVDVLITPPVSGESDEPRWRGKQLVIKSEPLGRAFGRLDVVFAGKGRGVGPQPSLEWAPRQVASMEQVYLDSEALLIALEKEGRGLSGENPGLDGDSRVDPSKDAGELRRALAEAKHSRAQAMATVAAMEMSSHLVVPGMVLIDPRLDEDEGTKARLADFHGANLARISAELRAGDPAPVGEQYAGQDLCIACHAEEVAQWARGPHARAWLHLTRRGETRNATCLVCHTTGFGQPGGFADVAENDTLLNVQCESCHGPMRLHAQQADKVGVRPSVGLPISEKTCTKCHDEENSPRFDCASYLRTVRHAAPPDEVDASLSRVCGPSPGAR